MKKILMIVLGALLISTSAYAETYINTPSLDLDNQVVTISGNFGTDNGGKNVMCFIVDSTVDADAAIPMDKIKNIQSGITEPDGSYSIPVKLTGNSGYLKAVVGGRVLGDTDVSETFFYSNPTEVGVKIGQIEAYRASNSETKADDIKGILDIETNRILLNIDSTLLEGQTYSGLSDNFFDYLANYPTAYTGDTASAIFLKACHEAAVIDAANALATGDDVKAFIDTHNDVFGLTDDATYTLYTSEGFAEYKGDVDSRIINGAFTTPKSFSDMFNDSVLLKYNEARFFEEEPESVTRFKEILDAAKEAGYEFATPSEVIAQGNVLENNYVDNIENGVAWHGGTAKAWANTEYSRIMDPVCMNILNGIKAVAEKLGETLDTLDTDLNNAMMALASAWVSDSRWPPAPTSPGRFNVRESLDDMYKANEFVEKAMINGGIAHKRGLYSPNLMKTQIKAIDDLLMDIKYFGE